jgi:hypothetical protein
MAALITRFRSGTISSTTEIAVLDIDAYTNLSYQANVSGSLAGTLELYLSNERNGPWIKKEDTDLVVVGGQNYMVEIIGIATAYCKFVIDVDSGSGEVYLVPCAKGIG